MGLNGINLMKSKCRWYTYLSPFIIGLTICRISSGQSVNNVPQNHDVNRFLLIVSEMNGQVTALNVLKSGQVEWNFDTKEPLISSTITKLELNESGILTRLIPGLDGRLYQFDGEVIEPLPLSADNLLDSSLRFHENSFIVGGKELSSIGLDPDNGQVQYTCNSKGCDTMAKSHLLSQNDNVLVLSSNSKTVRAIDMKSGQEKWNFSVGQHELSFISTTLAKDNDGENSKQETTDPSSWDYLAWFAKKDYDYSDLIDIKVIVPKGIVKAVYKTDPSNTLWTHQFSAAIAGAWTLQGHTLQKISLFDDRHIPALASSEEETETKVAREGEEALLYLGMYNNQLYVQPSVKLLRNTISPFNKAVAISLPKVSWRPYIATAPSRTPSLGGQQNSKQLTWDQSTEVATWQDQYPFGIDFETADTGYYLLDQALVRSEITDLNQNMSYNSLTHIWWQAAAAVIVTTFVISLAIHVFVAKQFGHKNFLRLISYSTETDILPVSDTTSTDNSSLKSSAADSVQFSSRYSTDFEQLERLGHGGFGVVFTARNRLDDCVYAIKRIPLNNSDQAREKAMREVKALAKLDHVFIVRYYQAWFEHPPEGWQEERDKLDELSSPPATLGMSELSSQDVTSQSFNKVTVKERKSSNLYHVLPNIGFGDAENSLIYEHEKQKSVHISKHSSELLTSDKSLLIESNRVTFDLTCSTFDQEINSASQSINLTDSISMDIVFEKSKCRCTKKRESSIMQSDLLSSRPSVESNTDQLNSQSTDIFFLHSECEECTRSKRFTTSEIVLKQSQSVNKQQLSSSKPLTKRKRRPRMYLYIQMQLCQRESLRDWLLCHVHDRDRSQSLSIFEQIVLAVDYVHSNGLMHRDLKPSNIFFAMDGKVKIGDFGLATAVEEQPFESDSEAHNLTGNHTNQVGTRLYMSPEQEMGRNYTHKVDIYSLGLIFFEMFHPFDTQMERTMTLQKVKQLEFPPNFCQLTDEYEFVLPLLSHNPEERPSTTNILRHKLLHDFETAREAYTRLQMKVVSSTCDMASSFNQ